MKKFSTVLYLLLLGLLIPTFVSSPVNSSSGWSTPTQLTNNLADDTNPSICDDGSKIAFVSDVDGDYEIFIVNSDGSGLTQLTHNTVDDTYPSISGDGSKIAFTSNLDGDDEIFIVNSDGTGLTQLTHNTATDSDPSISGDGLKVAFMSIVDGEWDWEIFVVNSDGSGLTQLTSNTKGDMYPSISGDGSKIAFESGIDIAVINSDGSGLTQLTSNTAIDSTPSISDDGQKKIAFVSDSDGTMEPDDSEIFVINSDGSGLTQLTSNSVGDYGPSICSDGLKISFFSYGANEIFVVNSDGSGLTQVTYNTSPEYSSSICGDGSKIVFVLLLDGDYEIFVVNFLAGSLSVSPSFGPGGVDVEFSGSGYPPSETVTLKYFDSSLGSWSFLGTADADASGNILFSTEVPDLRKSLRDGDYAEVYTQLPFRSEINGVIHSYADYDQYWRGMKTVGDQTAVGLFGNGTDLSDVVEVGEGDSLFLVGKWFHPGVVYVRWDGEAVVGTVTSDEWLDAQIIGTAVANEGEGYFETSVTIPDADPGEHYLSIEDSETKLIIMVYFGDSSNLEWSVDLFASSAEFYDLSTFGVAVDASDGFDVAYDSVDPPSPPTGVVSYFYCSGNPSQLQKLSASVVALAPALVWDYRVVSVGVSGSATISWDSAEVADIPSEKSVFLVCPDSSMVDMRSTTSYVFGVEDGSTYLFEVMVGGVSFVLDLSAGWNMVSFPCLPDDPSFSSIFSDIFAGVPFYQVIFWDGSGYVTPTKAEAGVGYWVLVLEETTITIENAEPITSYELELPVGWSMIGSIYDQTVDADDVFPSFYQLLTWDGTSYVTATTIEPGKSYWALVLEPTTITVGG